MHDRLGVRCALGVSNVSFGLPARELLNATFLAAALGAGLDAPIINPGSERYMDVIRSFRVLNAEDEGSSAYIERYAGQTDPYRVAADVAAGKLVASDNPAGAAAKTPTQADTPAAGAAGADGSPVDTADQHEAIRHLVVTGRRGETARACEELLATVEPLELIDGYLIPALDEVGALFDRGKLFLPQLMASAEAARAGFDVIRARSPKICRSQGCRLLATVKGDIHDIGKTSSRCSSTTTATRSLTLDATLSPRRSSAACANTASAWWDSPPS